MSKQTMSANEKKELHYIIETVSINDVREFDKIRYNTNNHWQNDTPPLDYEATSEATNSKHWVDQFKTYTTLRINLKSPTAQWLRNAHAFGVHTKRFPRQLEDERDMLAALLHDPAVFDGSTEYFIRTENVSLKYGVHGVGPYKSVVEIIESLVTCIDGHTPMLSSCDEIVLYLIPWVHIDPKREYRVFVHNNRITVASQQHLYNVYSDMSHFSSDMDQIYQYFETVIKTTITHLSSYVMDIAIASRIVGDAAVEEQVYFIELNPFGVEYPSGSALFGWLQDRDILYGDTVNDAVYLRYTTD